MRGTPFQISSLTFQRQDLSENVWCVYGDSLRQETFEAYERENGAGLCLEKLVFMT